MLIYLCCFFLVANFAYCWRFYSEKPFQGRFIAALNPLFDVGLYFGKRGAQHLVSKVSEYREEKKIFSELPLLIDNLRSCLKAGLCLDDALIFALRKRNWCQLISSTLTKIVLLRKAGTTMSESLTRVKAELDTSFSGRFLGMLLVSVLIGFETGGDLVQLLEKAQEKIQTSLDLRRKIKVFTAQMRMQSMVIALAPVGIAVLLLLLDPERILFFVRSLFGISLLVLMSIFYFVGIRMLNKLGSLDD